MASANRELTRSILLALQEYAYSHPTVAVHDEKDKLIRTDFAAMRTDELQQKLATSHSPEQMAGFREAYLELLKSDDVIAGGFYEHPTGKSSGEPTTTAQITPKGMESLKAITVNMATGVNNTSLDQKIDIVASKMTDDDMLRLKDSLWKGAIISVLSIAGAVGLGVVAALTASTGIMLAAIAGAALLGGFGMVKAYGTGKVSGVAAIVSERKKAHPGMDHPHSIQVPEQAMNEIGTAQSSKVDKLLAERAQQTGLAGNEYLR